MSEYYNPNTHEKCNVCSGKGGRYAFTEPTEKKEWIECEICLGSGLSPITEG